MHRDSWIIHLRHTGASEENSPNSRTERGNKLSEPAESVKEVQWKSIKREGLLNFAGIFDVAGKVWWEIFNDENAISKNDTIFMMTNFASLKAKQKESELERGEEKCFC